ncbi:MAG: 16S rRNA (cytosine(967)-C(5))-methyltransferase RsmB [Clostridiales bacterium]|nr:16S rRNA (cytosine(967)-C(5))-methyltransferase RsmB [Clostridiales bacterium]
MPAPRNVRRIAYDLLSGSAGRYSNLALDAAIKKNNLTPADRGLLTLLVMGVIEKQITLDYYIDKLSAIPPGKIEPGVRTLLRLGLYQLIFTDRIPAHAAVSETVALAPRRASGFVNALLRRFLRERGSISLPPRDSRPLEYLSIKYSFPVGLCGRLVEIFGFERTESLLSAFDRTPGLTLRVNILKTTREDLLTCFAEAGITAAPTPLSPDGICLDAAPPATLPGFDEGLFFVQDEASQLCVRALDARPGMTVIDACAAPGSKSFGIALTMQNSGRILAFDLHENKLSLIRSGAGWLGIEIIEVAPGDASRPDPALFAAADRVLCDVPCSGYGVMAKKPEIRYKNPDDAAGLPEVQYAILDNCSKYLKPGGLLVYSTCTILPEENEEVVGRFLARHPDFHLSPFTAGGLSTGGMITLYPDIHHTDGFFIACMKKD